MDTDMLNLPSKYLKHVANTWLLGADPEFAVITPPDGMVANEGHNAVNTTRPFGDIGSDHNGRVWELRPSASPSAYVVTANLWKLLRQPELDKLDKFKFKSGALGAKRGGVQAQQMHLQQRVQAYEALGYTHANAMLMAGQEVQAAAGHGGMDTLGGHVHFGLAGLNPAQRVGLNQITTALLNLDILPREENNQRLKISQYGKFDHDAVRDCNGHVEYRCAPSWLDRPGQAFAALTCYKLAATRPSTVKWSEDYGLKVSLLKWLDEFSGTDIDAHWLSEHINAEGFGSIQADPGSDFKPKWRGDDFRL